MEIVRIVVDELPEMCFMCPFSARLKDISVCAPKYNTRKLNNNHKYKISATKEPPSWCLLVKESEEE